MRLWSLHPKYLDRAGLVALWREALLAQKVLRGKTEGYRHHSQLARFKRHNDPTGAIAAYLRHILAEAERRGYRFNGEKIGSGDIESRIPVTNGQLRFEWEHLKKKLKQRDVARYAELLKVELPEAHPLFEVVSGEVEEWEQAS